MPLPLARARATRGETVPQGVRGGLRTVAWEVSASRVSIKTEFEVGLLERRKCSRPYGKGETTMRRHEGGLSGIERARLARSANELRMSKLGQLHYSVVIFVVTIASRVRDDIRMQLKRAGAR